MKFTWCFLNMTKCTVISISVSYHLNLKAFRIIAKKFHWGKGLPNLITKYRAFGLQKNVITVGRYKMPTKFGYMYLTYHSQINPWTLFSISLSPTVNALSIGRRSLSDKELGRTDRFSLSGLGSKYFSKYLSQVQVLFIFASTSTLKALGRHQVLFHSSTSQEQVLW